MLSAFQISPKGNMVFEIDGTKKQTLYHRDRGIFADLFGLAVRMDDPG